MHKNTSTSLACFLESKDSEQNCTEISLPLQYQWKVIRLCYKMSLSIYSASVKKSSIILYEFLCYLTVVT